MKSRPGTREPTPPVIKPPLPVAARPKSLAPPKLLPSSLIGSVSLRGTVPVSLGAPPAPPNGLPPVPMAIPLPHKPPRFPGDGTGLLGRYYFGVNFQRLAFERPDRSIEFEWTGSSPDPVRLPVGNAFSVQWHGGLVPRYTETYTIYTASDDGVRVWIDGKMVIDDWSIHSVAEDAVTMPMEAGRIYDLRVEYFEKNGLSGETIKLYWQSPRQPRAFIPQSQLRFPE